MRITPTEPDPLVGEYLRAKEDYERVKLVYEETRDRLIKQMEADQRKSYSWQHDGRRHSLTYVQSNETVVDEKGLRRALTARVFDKYTKRVLDRKAMEAALDAGQVDAMTVSRFVTLRPKRPYLTYRSPGAAAEETA